MKNLIILALVPVIAGACSMKAEKQENVSLPVAEPSQSFYDFKINSIDGKPVDFTSFKGKKVLIVNVASKCGYTPQYEDLQKLHEQYGSRVTVLGFPANNFGSQEPGTNQEIAEFCSSKFNVTFQMFEKISVKGDDMHPLYQWLTKKELNGWNDEAPSWNFCKYLIDENGNLIGFFPSKVKPLSDELLAKINP